MQRTTSGFPNTYAKLPRALLLEAFSTAPPRLRAALHGLSQDQLRARPRPGKWSAQEIAIHVTDSEIMGAIRFRYAFADPGSPVMAYDQDRWVRNLGHVDASPEALERSLTLFTALRADATPFLRSICGEAWERAIMHAEFGPITLRQLLELYADHGERQIQQILHLRELLGAPTDVPLVLADRLL